METLNQALRNTTGDIGMIGGGVPDLQKENAEQKIALIRKQLTDQRQAIDQLTDRVSNALRPACQPEEAPEGVPSEGSLLTYSLEDISQIIGYNTRALYRLIDRVDI